MDVLLIIRKSLNLYLSKDENPLTKDENPLTFRIFFTYKTII